MVLDTNQRMMLLSGVLQNDSGSPIDLALVDELGVAGAQLDPDAPWDVVEPSAHAVNTINPIRRIVDAMNVTPNPELPLLKLHIGDPTITGILPTHDAVNQAVLRSLTGGRYNGYGPAVGFPEVRSAVAKYASKDGRLVDADDVILTSGCSHALQMAVEALAHPGQNILAPKPGFPLYETLTHPLGIEIRHYGLMPERNWEMDLAHLESLIDEQTAAIIVNNPNNPTGAVYSKAHLEDLLKLAEKHRVPIIADEIYGDMVFDGAVFYPLRNLEPRVPMLTCDGISKRYLVPGWRLGWLIISDVDQAFERLRPALCQLAQKIVGPCSLIQGALPELLEQTPESFFQHTRDVLAENARIVQAELTDAKGLRPIAANGAMYMMISVDTAAFPAFANDELAMIRALIAEESLYCLPGSAFYYPGAIRFVMTHSRESMLEACRRLRRFCDRHFRPSSDPVVRRPTTALNRPSAPYLCAANPAGQVVVKQRNFKPKSLSKTDFYRRPNGFRRANIEA